MITEILLIIFVLIAILFAILNWIMKKQIKKLEGGYNAKEDKSRPVGKYRVVDRGTGETIGTTEPEHAGDVEPERREVLQNTTAVDTGESEPKHGTDTDRVKKSKRTLRNLFKRRGK